MTDQTKWAADVAEFMRATGQEIRTEPGWPDLKTLALRGELIFEESGEISNALAHRDLPETADGLVDLIYVAIGALHAFGVDPDPIWNEIHKTNMAKLGGERREDGKILKPPGWTPPDVAGLLRKQAERARKSRIQQAVVDFAGKDA